jgi:hypothetical protein
MCVRGNAVAAAAMSNDVTWRNGNVISTVTRAVNLRAA